jgi:hypothetical protein
MSIGPSVQEVVESDVGTWTVMDQVQPGTRVLRSSSIADLLRPLAAAAPAAPESPPISRVAYANVSSTMQPPTRLQLFRLPGRRNANASCRSSTIDPRAVSGDIEYDAAVLALRLATRWASWRDVSKLTSNELTHGGWWRLRRGFDRAPSQQICVDYHLGDSPGLKEVPEIIRVELVNPMRREVLDREVGWIAGGTS